MKLQGKLTLVFLLYLITFLINNFRVEFDAYRMDLENSKPEIPQHSMVEETQKNFTRHKELYEKLRADVAIKMQFLDENRVNVKLFF